MKDNNSFYQQLIKKASFGYAYHELIFDAGGKACDYRFLEVNEAFQKLTGLFEDNIIGKTVQFVFPDIDKSAFDWINTYAAVALTGKSIEIEQYFEPLNRWFKVEVFSTELNFFTTIFTDITKVKKKAIEAESIARQTKEESNERIRNLIEAMPDMVFLMKRDGTILEIFGGNPELLIAADHALIGSSIKDCFDEEEFHRHVKIYEECIEKNKTGLIEFELFINGKRMFFESRIKPLDNERLLTIVRDKTDQKQLLERISDGFVAMDADLNYIFVNDAGGKLLGRSPQELIGKNYWTEFPEAKGTPFGNAYLDAMANQETLFIEEHYEPWNRWFSNAIYPSPNGLSIIFQEITEKKLAEIALRESEKRYAFLAENANQLAGLTTLKEIYAFTATKINEILNGHSIVAVVEYYNHTGKWKMQHLEGVGKSITKISKVIGYDLRHLEGEINTKFNEKIVSGKLVELAFDFPGLFNNKLSDNVGMMIKKMMSIDKMYCIALKQSDQIFGNITFTTSAETSKVNTDLIEAFLVQVNNFVKRLTAEEELKLSEEKFSTAFHQSPNIIGLSDIESGEYIEVNQTFFDIMEYKPDDIVGKKVVDLVKMDPAFREKTLETLNEKGAVRNLETTLFSKTGKPIHVLLSADIIRINDKEYNFTTGVDITELKNTEKSRYETDSRFRAYVDHAPLGVYVVDQHGNYLEVNDEGCRLTGYSRKELLNKNLLEIIAPEDIDAAKLHFQLVLSEGRSQGELAGLTKAGEKRFWSVVAAKISDDRFIGFHEDITDRKLVDQSLLGLQANLTAIVENTLDSIWSINTNYEITYINEVFAASFNAAFGVLLKQGSNLLQSLPHSIQPFWKEQYDHALAGERIVFENTVDTPETFISIEVAANPIIQQGEVIGASLFGRDITERKKNERALQESEALLQSIFKSAPIGIGLMIDRVLLQVNERFCQMTGYAEEEVIGKNARFLYCTQSEFERIGKEKYAQIAKHDTGTVETKWKRKNNEEIDILLSSTPIDTSDLSKGVTFTAIDITRQKRAEQAILISNQRLESFLEISQNITKTLDQENIIQMIVDNAIGIMGLKTGAVYLKDDEETIRLAATSPPLPLDFPENAKIAILKNHPHIERALTTGRYVILADTFSAKLTPEEEEIVRMRNLRSNLYIPILLREKPLGILILSSHELIENFKDEDIYLLQGFANQAAHILDNINNFEELKNYANELKAQIKQRKETEHELRKLSQAVEQSPASVVITDINGVIEYVNPRFSMVTGYTLEEAKGQKPSILKSGNQSDEVYKELWEHVSSGMEWRGELQNKKKNGELYWESVSVSPIIDDEGVTKHYLAVKEDVTDRKMMEENLIQQSYLKELLMEISSGFINLPLEHVDEAVNNALSRMGEFVSADRAYTFDYDWGRNVCDNIYEWCDEDISPEIENLQGVPLDMMLEWVDVHKIGEAMYVPDVFALAPHDGVRQLLEPQGVKSVLSVPMMNEGQCIGFVGFDSVRRHHTYSDVELQLLKMFAQMLANVKLRKQIFDQLLIAKEKAEESNRLKTAFLQNMSHEVRTPLNGIIGFSDLINDAELTAEDRKRFTDIIIERGWQLTSIINDILTISAIETGQEELFDEKFEINQFLNNHLEVFKKNINARGLQLKSNIRLGAEQFVVFGDRPKIGQILNNLFNNALKFTKEGTIELGCSLNNGMLEFYVKDTGIGIEKEKQSVIFERFAQADDNIRRDFGGTGLGLSICKGFVDLMGGQIWVTSEPDKGATFHFTIPFKPAATANNIGVKELEFSLPGKKLTVLVAEDEISNYFVLEVILKKMNFNVLRAINGEEAIEICKNEAVDLVLMDIKMPVLDGYEAALLIRELRPDLYIIAQTAHAAQSEIVQYKDAFDDYITKPFTKEKIKSCVEKFVLKIIK
jgi:PAS domain S-box-containing protein